MEPSYLNALVPDISETMSNQSYNIQSFEKICNEPFRPDEIYISMDRQRIIGKLSQFIYNNNINDYCFSLLFETQNFNSSQRLRTVLSVNKHGVLMIPQSIQRDSSFEYDLLFIYNVYSNRLNCMKELPSFAIEQTMKILDNRINIFQLVKNNGIISDLYIHHLTYIYSYLFMNCYVFNILIEPKLSFEKFKNIPVNIRYVNSNLIEKIEQDLNYMIKELRKKIMAL